MRVRAPHFANSSLHVVSDAELPHGERPPPRDTARAARWWPVVGLAAVLPMTLAAMAAAATHTPLVATSLILVAVATVMRSTDRRTGGRDERSTASRAEDR